MNVGAIEGELARDEELEEEEARKVNGGAIGIPRSSLSSGGIFYHHILCPPMSTHGDRMPHQASLLIRSSGCCDFCPLLTLARAMIALARFLSVTR